MNEGDLKGGNIIYTEACMTGIKRAWHCLDACLFHLFLPPQLITCNVCLMAFGKFFSVQMGMDFSGGSWLELYDSVRKGITTCTLPWVPSVPDSRSGLR